MKRWICALLAALLLPAAAAAADYDPKQNYLDILFRAACCGDRDAGRAAAICYNEWLDDRHSLAARLDFDELLWLAKIIEHEAGSSGIGLDWRMCVGEVVLNRVASPEFPDTLREVVYQRGQYNVVNTARFSTLAPRRPCVDAALRLLQGERRMVPAVVFQSDSIQGELFTMYADRRLGNTYFCLSERLELYP